MLVDLAENFASPASSDDEASFPPSPTEIPPDLNGFMKFILVCGIGPDEYNRISACQSAKEIWEALQTAHEGITQVKPSKIDMLTTEYELFRMKDDEFIHDIHTRFTSIINELYSLGEIIPRNKLVRKILSVLPGFWESKVNAIIEAKDL
ncbi:PREDICTED: uncharacterized protein LOC109211892 [Nicotiana attenuata]|uniref:uncharacterized protein LOC109211892 n=1 Tax=Nicotiana attenuata TaxID=49451 RepID=UPI00090569F8|nr:PREDICTED: uncharacterized protein LOC109211892 [Nicotiana attenuata]